MVILLGLMVACCPCCLKPGDKEKPTSEEPAAESSEQ